MTNDSDIDKTLVWLTEHNAITLRQLFEGQIAYGTAGSSKKTEKSYIASEKPLTSDDEPSQVDGET